MAITHDYVAYATGNDYKGSTFTDGSFANATLTLTKAGAFAATKVNHWLYLDDNGSGEVTTGYYRVTSIAGAPDAVVLDADIRSGANDPTDVKCTQHDGTTTLPWRSVQGALDLTTLNATDGNQVNIIAGTAVVNTAALNLTTFGGTNNVNKLTLRGCTATANDEGIGEIDCGGTALWTSAYNHVNLVDLEIHTFGDNNGITTGNECMVFRCEIHKGASSPSSKHLVVIGTYCCVIGCYLHDNGDGTDSQSIRCPKEPFYVAWNYVVTACFGIQTQSAGGTIANNVINCTNTQAIAIRTVTSREATTVVNNACYNSTAGTVAGISCGGSGYPIGSVLNNIVVGWSGVGGVGIKSDGDSLLLNNNAFYNNTTPISVADQQFIPFTDGNVTLAADPFTDAANGDFSLTAAAKTALAAKGWPTSYFGAHANTVPNLNIGPIQMAAGGAAGGGFPILGGSVVR